jgi:hypothetical protein
MSFNSEYNMDECTWDNLAENTLVIDYDEPETMYASENEPCGYTMTSDYEEYVMCVDGLTCKAVEDPNATDSYGYTTICVNDTINYGDGAAGVWQSNSTNVTGFNGTGFWFTNGTWVTENGMMRGTWNYDSNS